MYPKILALLLCLSIIITAFSACDKTPILENPSSEIPSAEISSEIISSEGTSSYVTSSEDDAARFEGHYLLTRKGASGVKELLGKIVITAVLVDSEETSWDEDSISAFKSRMDDAVANLTKWAGEYGKEVDISVVYKEADIYGTSEMSSINNNVEEILNRAGLPSRYRLNHALKEEYGSDEAPVLICVAGSDRSGTYRYDDMPCEYTILNGKKTYTLTIEHELLHQFGATDYYYPANTEKYAKELFPDSIMLRIQTDVTMDEFTAYQIGWLDTVPPKGVELLEKTADNEESDSLTVDFGDDTTGYFSNRYVSVGNYTGYVENGLAQGEGKFVRVGGETYTGNFVDGKRSGYGVSVEASGERYEGEWENNKYNGQGTYYYSDGSVKYSGTFKDGEFIE